MSQNGAVVSVAQYCGAGVGGTWSNATISDGGSWIVQYAYQLDAGGRAQAQVIVGSGAHSVVALWTGPNSTITVPSSPGTVNPVVLSCPPLIAASAFGVPLR
jgi:hypothetical protein